MPAIYILSYLYVSEQVATNNLYAKKKLAARAVGHVTMPQNK